MVDDPLDITTLKAFIAMAQCEDLIEARDIVRSIPAEQQTELVADISRRRQLQQHMPVLLLSVPRERLVAGLGAERASQLYRAFL